MGLLMCGEEVGVDVKDFGIGEDVRERIGLVGVENDPSYQPSAYFIPLSLRLDFHVL